MGTSLGPKHVPYTYMDPLGLVLGHYPTYFCGPDAVNGRIPHRTVSSLGFVRALRSLEQGYP